MPASLWRCTTCKADNASPHADRPPEHCRQCGKVLLRGDDPELNFRISRGEPVATALRLDTPDERAAAGHGQLLAEMLDDVDRQRRKRKGCSGVGLVAVLVTILLVLVSRV